MPQRSQSTYGKTHALYKVMEEPTDQSPMTCHFSTIQHKSLHNILEELVVGSHAQQLDTTISPQMMVDLSLYT